MQRILGKLRITTILLSGLLPICYVSTLLQIFLKLLCGASNTLGAECSTIIMKYCMSLKESLFVEIMVMIRNQWFTHRCSVNRLRFYRTR
jgi:hypothetical protein